MRQFHSSKAGGENPDNLWLKCYRVPSKVASNFVILLFNHKNSLPSSWKKIQGFMAIQKDYGHLDVLGEAVPCSTWNNKQGIHDKFVQRFSQL